MAVCQQPPNRSAPCFTGHLYFSFQPDLLVTNGSLDTHIHRSHDAQQRRPCRPPCMEVGRFHSPPPKLHIAPLQFLRRLAQREVTDLRRMSPRPRLLHLPRQRLGSVFIAPILLIFHLKVVNLYYGIKLKFIL